MKLGHDVAGGKEIVIHKYLESKSGQGKNEHILPSRLPVT